MKGYKIYRELFASLPAIDGRMGEWTQQERDSYVKQLFINTQYVLKLGVLVPVKEDHQSKEDGALHGTLMGVELQWRDRPTPHYVIVGEIFLDDDYYELYKDGKLPAASVEIAEQANLMAYTGEDTVIGEYIFGVALCGSTAVAMPQLKQIDSYEVPYALFNRLLSGTQKYKYIEYKKETPMDFREKFLAAFSKLMDQFFPLDSEKKAEDDGMIEKAIEEVPAPEKPERKREGQDDEEEMECKDKKMQTNPQRSLFEHIEESKAEPKKETALDDKDKIIADLAQRVAKLEADAIEAEFKLLAGSGKLAVEQKKTFTQLASNMGIEFAKEVYSQKPTIVPPNDIIKSTDTVVSEVKTEEKKRLTMAYKRALPSATDEQIEEIFQRVVKSKTA